jgi:aldehyde dehydrogenase (NAD+)
MSVAAAHGRVEALEVSTHGTYIDGAWIPSQGESIHDSINPATGDVFAKTRASAPEQVDAAVESATRAFQSSAWRAFGPRERSALITAIADLLEDHREELARLISVEVGTPIGASRTMQLGQPIETLRWYAEMALKGPRGGYEQALPLYDNPVQSASLLRYEPVGVVAALSAFNYPINLLMWKLGGALAAGCTTVILPSPNGMLSTIRVMELMSQLDVPDGVINLVIGADAEVGVRLTSHPGINLVSFTGSDAVGERVMAQGALGSLSKAVLELGGKSANVILPGADIAAVTPASILRFSRNAGQGCAAWSRVLVHESQFDAFVEEAAAFIETIAVGDPMDESTIVGPIISARQREKVEELVEGALAEGARWGAGGGRVEDEPDGYFMKPGLLVDVAPDSAIAQTELFAPIGIAIPYSTVDEAVEIANATSYGLAANVFGDLDAAVDVAKRLRAGTVTINGGAGMRPDAPWGGPGRSGVGRELGEDGFAEFFEVKHIQYPLAGITRPPGT